MTISSLPLDNNQWLQSFIPEQDRGKNIIRFERTKRMNDDSFVDFYAVFRDGTRLHIAACSKCTSGEANSRINNDCGYIAKQALEVKDNEM